MKICAALALALLGFEAIVSPAPASASRRIRHPKSRQDTAGPYSQFGQETWVLDRFQQPRFYLDVGANDGQHFSNTKGLDDAGWKGICIDPFPENFETRSCKLVEHPLSNRRQNVTFFKAGMLGGIEEHLGLHRFTATGAGSQRVETRVLSEVLDELKAPAFIDYFSLDTEGSEEEILKTFPFYKYTFGAITVEHNYEEPKRSNINAVLSSNGYSLEAQVNVDDWYINNIFVSFQAETEN